MQHSFYYLIEPKASLIGLLNLRADDLGRLLAQECLWEHAAHGGRFDLDQPGVIELVKLTFVEDIASLEGIDAAFAGSINRFEISLRFFDAWWTARWIDLQASTAEVIETAAAENGAERMLASASEQVADYILRSVKR